MSTLTGLLLINGFNGGLLAGGGGRCERSASACVTGEGTDTLGCVCFVFFSQPEDGRWETGEVGGL